MLEGQALRDHLQGKTRRELAGANCCRCDSPMEVCVRGLAMQNGTIELVHRHYCEPCFNKALADGTIEDALPGEETYPQGDVC